MSLFTATTPTVQTHDKVLIWGPTHTGKTHLLLQLAPEPLAVADIENRALHFADRFNFLHSPVPNPAALAAVLTELRAGKLECESVAFDSLSAAWDSLVVIHTNELGITDWVTVKRRFLKLQDFVMSVHDKNVFLTAHAIQKYTRSGKDFQGAGVDFVGDNKKFRYSLDYIIRLEPTGPDPRTSAPVAIFEKSASPNIKIGDKHRGLDRESFAWLKKGEPKMISTPPPEAQQPISDERIGAIESLAVELKLEGSRLVELIKGASNGRTIVLRELTELEGKRAEHALTKRLETQVSA